MHKKIIKFFSLKKSSELMVQLQTFTTSDYLQKKVRSLIKVREKKLKLKNRFFSHSFED